MTMDVKLSAEHKALLSAVRGELERHRARHPAPRPSGSDLGSLHALAAAGYLDVMSEGGTAVDAVLVIEAAAASAPGAPVAGRALIGPLVTGRVLPAAVVVSVEHPQGGLARHAPLAEAFLVAGGDRAQYVEADDTEVEPAASRWGYTMGRVTVRGGEDLGPGSGDRLLWAWRLALAAEAGGLMEAATLHATGYVTVRQQFGKPIGSLQSIQHRLARAYVLSQAAKWLARRAAWEHGDAVAASAAACYAAEGMREVTATTHQVCGAIGFTDEFGLTQYTARMAMLQADLGGARAHARALARARWGSRVARYDG
jgi:hypothetical protein